MIDRILSSWTGVTFRPLVTAWIAGGLLGVGITQGWISISSALITWTGVNILLVIAANQRETRTMRVKVEHVEHLVNSAHDALVESNETLVESNKDLTARVTQLVEALSNTGAEVPDDPAGDK
jgi:hypothetical protein